MTFDLPQIMTYLHVKQVLDDPPDRNCKEIKVCLIIFFMNNIVTGVFGGIYFIPRQLKNKENHVLSLGLLFLLLQIFGELSLASLTADAVYGMFE